MANLTQEQLDAILNQWNSGWQQQETEAGTNRWNDYEGDIGVTTPYYATTHTGGESGTEATSETPSGFQRIVGYDGQDPILDTWDAEGNYTGRGRSSGSFISDLTDKAMPLAAMFFMPYAAGAAAGGGLAGAAASGAMSAGMNTVMGLGAVDTAGDTGDIAGMITGALGAGTGIAGLTGATGAANTLRDVQRAANAANAARNGDFSTAAIQLAGFSSNPDVRVATAAASAINSIQKGDYGGAASSIGSLYSTLGGPSVSSMLPSRVSQEGVNTSWDGYTGPSEEWNGDIVGGVNTSWDGYEGPSEEWDGGIQSSTPESTQSGDASSDDGAQTVEVRGRKNNDDWLRDPIEDAGPPNVDTISDIPINIAEPTTSPKTSTTTPKITVPSTSQTSGTSPQYGGSVENTVDIIAKMTPVDMTPEFLKRYKRDQEGDQEDFDEDDFKQLLSFVGID